MRGEYSTRQKRELLRFLKERSLQHFSVDDVVFEMQDRGERIGRTTVYRYLELMAEQGTVRKYQNNGVTQYQHVEDDTHCDDHFHMMCSACGNLMHVDCGLMRAMCDHLMKEHGFRLNPRETIMVGLCEKCREAKGEVVEHAADSHEGCHHCL